MADTLNDLVAAFLKPIVTDLVKEAIGNLDMNDIVSNAVFEYLDSNLKDAVGEVVNDAEITISV